MNSILPLLFRVPTQEMTSRRQSKSLSAEDGTTKMSDGYRQDLAICDVIDLMVEQHYWRTLFLDQPNLASIGSFKHFWPLIVIGYSRYLTHIRRGEDAFFEACMDAALAAQWRWCHHAAEHIFFILRDRLASLAADQQCRSLSEQRAHNHENSPPVRMQLIN
ncbi:hypothetical protein [Xanthomonas axonopodis]